VNKIVIYTAISGSGRDSLRDPAPVAGVDYVCFTDQQIKSKVWSILPFKHVFSANGITAKHPKILPHEYFPDHELSIWVDGNMCPKKNIVDHAFVFLKEHPIALHKHPRRDCLFDEGEFMKKIGKASVEEIQPQIDSYSVLGVPRSFGLWECGMIFRYHNSPTIMHAMDAWWSQLIKFKQFNDQLSFSFVVWMFGLTVNTINKNVREAPYVEYHPHCDMTHDGKSVVIRKQTKKEAIRELIDRQRNKRLSLKNA
jgi:hypothetical protein